MRHDKNHHAWRSYRIKSLFVFTARSKAQNWICSGQIRTYAQRVKSFCRLKKRRMELRPSRYESVIGFGKCAFVSDGEEIIQGLKLLTEHYGYNEYPLDRCAGLGPLLVGKIVPNEISGKKKPSGFVNAASRADSPHWRRKEARCCKTFCTALARFSSRTFRRGSSSLSRF